jgi:hypothetical protein
VDIAILILSMSGTVAKRGPRKYIGGLVHLSTVLVLVDLVRSHLQKMISLFHSFCPTV